MTAGPPRALTRKERIDRTRARAWALQTLYRWEALGMERDPLDVLSEMARMRRIAPSRYPFVRVLVGAVAQHREELDVALSQATTNWRLERLSRIDRTVLRIGGAELLFVDETPAPVAIQEAVRLAGRYGGDDSARFVNGVLDALLHGPGGRGAGEPGEGGSGSARAGR